ncbi:uncharacterized protein C6orf132 homolog isoform X2 [Channa argus]|uniref:uncharacterized protein C6orf132 homolog isoform X2 n=1 Tax=Channa argus TaxID=215402 RepID=UPI003522DE71
MKKGALNFLGRKNQSLFDTNIKIKDMDNVELVLDSAAAPESGTASVRARPTVKHHASSDSFQGFAVPTPKVPLLPPVNGPKVNGSVGQTKLSNGSVISVPDLVEGEIFVPPPPSMAPPPPPESFVPPPPDFIGDLNSRNLQPLSGSTSRSKSMEVDHAFLKPPPMTPPKPPSIGMTSTASSIPSSYPLPDKIPEPPKFAPPQPPIERQQKTHKAPPPKPIRLSSISTLDSPPQTPAPPPPVQAPTLSSFNPQNTAKIYSLPKASILSGYEDRDTRPKQMLLLEDSVSVKSSPVLVQVDGKAPKEATPLKSAPKGVQEVNENLQITQPSQPPPPQPKKEAQTVAVSGEPDIAKPPHFPSQLPKMNSTQVNLEPGNNKYEGSPSQIRKFSPLIDRKLRNLKSSETSGTREGHGASPLALLMAAKEREKHKSTPSLSQENTAKKNEQQSASIHPSDSSPNSFVVVPQSSSSPASRVQESPKPITVVECTPPIPIPTISNSTPLVTNQLPSTSPALSQITGAASPSVTSLGELTQKAELSLSKSQQAQPENSKSALSMPVLPPPPEFDDLDELMEPPPSIPPPDPPLKKSPTPTVSLSPPVLAPTVSVPSPAPVPAPTVSPPPPGLVPSPPPKPKSPVAPKFPPSDINVKPKSQVQTKTQVVPTQLPSTLSPSQATLLSILQKKMLEMDHKMGPVREAESGSDDWGTPLSDEDNKVPVVSKATPQSKINLVTKKAATLDMRELEGKVLKKNQETSSVKVPTSNGPSKHPYGLTFTVRPGTKQPITLVSKGESS